MTDILRLPGWKVSSVAEDDDSITIEAEYTVPPTVCLVCAVVGAALYKHGVRSVTFLDTPIHGKHARLAARVQRYRCRECGGIFPQPLDGVDDDRRMTKRCLAYVEKQCLRNTFQHVSESLGCDEKTVRNVAGSYIAAQDDEYRPTLPVWLGVDETKLAGAMRLILTDVKNRRPVDILRDREKGTFAQWLTQFHDRSHVKGVATDMWKPYRDVAAEMLPGRPVVIDKFHVVRMANQCMERVRVRLGKTRIVGVRRDWMRRKSILRMRPTELSEQQRFNLQMWLENEPDIAAAYELKERFYSIYDMPKAKAIAAYDGFAASVPASMKEDFKELTRAMKNWRTEILAYFDHPITNGYTESLNGVAKVINRAGRGYSYDVIRARILFSNRPLSKRQIRAKRTAEMADMYRCFCCEGLYRADEMAASAADLAHLRAFEPTHAEVDNGLIMCRECEERFNQEETMHHLSLSTD